MLRWLQTLPLLLDMGRFRIAHAAWAEPAVAEIRAATPTAVLDDALLVRAADLDDAFGVAVEAVAKGPEVDLPAGFDFLDKGGFRRSRVRIAWWCTGAETWRELATSVPDPEGCLPDGRASDEALSLSYSATAPPVFVGHYWLTGAPAPRSHNVFCLDYSAGAGGPLVSYNQAATGGAFDLSRLTMFP